MSSFCEAQNAHRKLPLTPRCMESSASAEIVLQKDHRTQAAVRISSKLRMRILWQYYEPRQHLDAIEAHPQRAKPSALMYALITQWDTHAVSSSIKAAGAARKLQVMPRIIE